MTTPKVDVCTLNAIFKKDKSLVNRWAAAVIDIIEDTVPGALHECPYNVSHFHVEISPLLSNDYYTCSA